MPGSGQTTKTTVHAPCGALEGQTKHGVQLFAGIPYAEPPLGALRFKAPRPHPGWSGTRQALKFGPAAPQEATGGMTNSVPVRWDEDCLTLNVTTPACDSARRPVLVWIHGGAYRTGQGAIPWYNGTKFAHRGIVVVSINYRLGALGFTDLSRFGADYADSGVAGTLDQIAALSWVQQNIEAFGGDPQQVTIAGESAGGFSVATLLASPLTEGLFQRAIPQSGAGHHTLSAAAGRKVADELLRTLGLDTALGLEALDAAELLTAQAATCKALRDGAAGRNELGEFASPFYPVQGTRAVPVAPIDAIAAGAGARVAVLTGSNRHETTLWGYGAVDEARLQRLAGSMMPAGASDTDTQAAAEQVLATYRAAAPDADPAALLTALTTDHMFRIPAIRLLEARLAHTSDNWLYWFCWESRAFDGRLGATHALEIPFAFDNLDQAGVDVFLGAGETPQQVADVMHDAWVKFIVDGDPGWAAYEETARPTMRFDEESGVVEDPQAAERQAWDGRR